MVSEERLALSTADKVVAGYLGFVTLVIIWRGDIFTLPNIAMLTMHALFGVLFFLFTRLRPSDTAGRFMHDLYPGLMLMPFYAQFAFLNPPVGSAEVFAHDAVVQGWEEALFGAQISYTWIRSAPSVFWSGLLHFSYFLYYPLLATPVVVWFWKSESSRRVMLAMIISFVLCYLTFILYPVAGPNYTFDHPTGPVREVWSARLIYNILDGSSSFGTAFPSSHVAGTLAATLGWLKYERRIGIAMITPCALLIIATVYCQMHYGVDALAGMIYAVVGCMIAFRLRL